MLKKYNFGPIIGILTFQRVAAESFKEPVRYAKILRLYTEYAKRMNGIGLLYVFGPNDLNPERRTITGRFYNQSTNTWQLREFPYPDAVIDRMYPNNYEVHRKLEMVIGQNKIFNKKNLINKLEFSKVLGSIYFLKDFIPETRLFNRLSDLNYFLNKYHGVFLKPLDGMKGIGIVYVTIKADGLHCRYMKDKKLISVKISKPNQIFDVLRCANTFKRPYIIQAAVNRMKYKNRPFNFRIMVTKNGSGLWSTRAIFAKAALPGSFLTNRSLGAEYVLLKDLFTYIENRLPYTKQDFLNLLFDLAIKTAKALDKEFGPLGKLGLDAVVDTSGKPWLIEANGNPGRICPDVLAEFPDWSDQVYDDPIAYAMNLAGFNNSLYI